MTKLITTSSLLVIAGVIAAAGALSMTKEQSVDKTSYKDFFDYPAATENIYPVGDAPPVTPRLIEHGYWVYRGLCVGCHGVDGDGNGAVWSMADDYAPEHKLPRKPRDFTQAVFKIRSTPSGSFPTDLDLFTTISRGLVADLDMPAFKFLPERDRWAVVAYIKTLSDRWKEEAEYQEDAITVGLPPIPDQEMIANGKQVYATMKCAKCHGILGKGDGPSAPELEDDNGIPIVPRDFGDPDQFVGSSDPRGIFQTFNTGLDGTPMPSFSDFLDEEQSWQLVWYVMSLRLDWNLENTREKMLRERNEQSAQSDAGSNLTAAIQ